MARPIKSARVHFPDLVLYEDDTLLAIDKPSGLSSLQERQATASGVQPGLLAMGRERYPELKICHRLDKFTSGVLLFAKTDEAYRHVALQFQRREVIKLYWALVPGALHWEEELVELALHESRGGKVVVSPSGKPAATGFHSIRIFKHYTLLAAVPLTGRQHQIRVHLAARRAPIVGDTLYGGEDLLLSALKRRYRPETEEEERPLNSGYLLHARELQLLHPSTEAPLKIEAPLTKNFRVCLEVLEKYDSV
jgi:23S rRNA pseudouridine955/2504/2580 synthase